MIRSTTVLDVAADYARVRGACKLHGKNLLARARMLSEHVQSLLPVDCFNESAMADFLDHYAQAHRPATVKAVRGDLLTLWRYAADSELVAAPLATRVPRRNVPAGIPECYTLDEVRQLVADADALAGFYPGGTPISTYWRAAIRVAWDAGLRRSDVWRVTSDAVRPDGTLVMVAHKTGSRTVHRLAPDTVSAVRAVKSLAWRMNAWTFTNHFAEIVQRTVQRGTFKWLRRASGSYVAALHGEAAGAEHLGHTSVATFRRFYDARLVTTNRPAPPAL